MNYKLKCNLTHSPENCLVELLTARGVENIEGYINPSKEYELDPYLLDNISEAADLLFKHLENDIWELRPLRDRILFAYWYNNKFIILSHFMKQTQKTPKTEIAKAKRYLNDFKKRNDMYE